MLVGTWTRLSAVPVRSLYRRPQSRHRKRRKPCTVRPSRSVVDDDWQCGQFMTALLIAQNGSREPIRWGRSRQAAPRSDRTRPPAGVIDHATRSKPAKPDQAEIAKTHTLSGGGGHRLSNCGLMIRFMMRSRKRGTTNG